MDWQFKVGLGLAIFFGLLQFASPHMPLWIVYPGLAVGVLICGWGLVPQHDKVSVRLGVTFLTLVAVVVGLSVWRLTPVDNESSRLEFVHYVNSNIEQDGTLAVTFVMSNKGSAPLWLIRRRESSFITDEALDEQEEDIEIAKHLNSTYQEITSRTNQWTPQYESMFTARIPGWDERVKKAGGKPIFGYAFEEFIYEDAFIPDNQERVTERCFFVTNMASTFNECIGHNQFVTR